MPAVLPFEKFLRHLQYEKRFSIHTVTAYRNDLTSFFDYLQVTYQFSDPKVINHFYIRSWIVTLIENKIAARSVNRKISSLKSFFRFLLREKAIEKNPMVKIISPKTPKRLPAFVTKEKMDELIDHTAFKEGFPGLRDKLIIEFFYGTGMRLSELIQLRDTDIDFGNLSVKVRGKRNKERIIPISLELKNLARAYKEEKKKLFSGLPPDQNIFFVLDDGNKLYPKFVYRLVKSKLSEVTTLEKKSPHVLRHTFATQMLNNGAEINAVKELLGHSSLAATQVYTHNTIEKLKNIHKQAHPKA